MRIWLSAFLFFAFHLSLFAQLFDDFSDGNLSSNPAWNGDTADFVITPDHRLQLNAEVAGNSFLFTPFVSGDSAEWSFHYTMEFAPSATNKMRVYLALDGDTLTQASGYFIEIGENGAADALRFFRSDAGTASELFASDGLFGGDPSSARIHIRRNANGEWFFSADLGGGENYAPLFNINDATYLLSGSKVFAIECTYTDTRKDKFFFDDFFAGLPAPDIASPILIELLVIDSLHLLLRFNEELDAESLGPSHYLVSPSIGTASSVMFTNVEQQEVELTLPSALQTSVLYTLQITDVQDVSGNVTDTTIQFQYLRIDDPQPFDILVNEIMADPSPVVGLPNAEYLELYNKSGNTFRLEDYALTVGSQTELLPAWQLEAGSFVVLVNEEDVSLFTGISNVLGIDLPSLTNSGTTIEIADDAGTVLHRIAYDLNSYQDPSRDEGGWSLEFMNPFAPCNIAFPWRASMDLTGGTPGRVNSVQSNEADISGPVLERIFPLSNTLLQLVFDEIINVDQFMGSLEPFHAFTDIVAEDNILEITLQTPLQPGILYTMLTQEIADCIGNSANSQTLQFALPQEIQAGDLLINELLFDPQTGGSRFIEIINASNKYLDLSDVIIADIQGDTIAVSPVTTSFLLFPGSLAAITPSVSDIRMRYFMHDPAQLIENDLPSFDRTEGNATIYTRSGIVLDVFDYHADFHNALLDDAQGVSLERISTNLNTQSSATWHSAAQSAGFATPGLPNSQQLPEEPGSGRIEVIPEVFSPDQDGTDDFVTIQFTDLLPGMLASVRVFDATGRPVARIADNISLGQDAVIRWDGIDEHGQRARVGPYVLWIELYSAEGTVERFKRTCVLAERL